MHFVFCILYLVSSSFNHIPECAADKPPNKRIYTQCTNYDTWMWPTYKLHPQIAHIQSAIDLFSIMCWLWFYHTKCIRQAMMRMSLTKHLLGFWLANARADIQTIFFNDESILYIQQKQIDWDSGNAYVDACSNENMKITIKYTTIVATSTTVKPYRCSRNDLRHFYFINHTETQWSINAKSRFYN